MKWADVPTCHRNDPHMAVFKEDDWRAPVDTKDDAGYPNVQPWRSCSYCGSIHPADLIELTKKVEFLSYPMDYDATKPTISLADMKYGKPHKFYVYPKQRVNLDIRYTVSLTSGPNPEIRTAKGYEPWAKFYADHLLDDGIDDEAFSAISAVLLLHAGVVFTRTEKGLMWNTV